MSMPTTNFNLLLIMMADLARHLLRVLLFLALIASAIAVVLSSHHNRQLSMTHEALIQERDQLDIEWRHLVIEQSALTEHNRIELMVQKDLNMRRPQSVDEVLVRVK